MSVSVSDGKMDYCQVWKISLSGPFNLNVKFLTLKNLRWTDHNCQIGGRDGISVVSSQYPIFVLQPISDISVQCFRTIIFDSWK